MKSTEARSTGFFGLAASVPDQDRYWIMMFNSKFILQPLRKSFDLACPSCGGTRTYCRAWWRGDTNVDKVTWMKEMQQLVRANVNTGVNQENQGYPRQFVYSIRRYDKIMAIIITLFIPL